MTTHVELRAVSATALRTVDTEGEEHDTSELGVVFGFVEDGFGFGQITVRERRDSLLQVDVETLDAERIRRYFLAFADRVIEAAERKRKRAAEKAAFIAEYKDARRKEILDGEPK